MLNFDKFFQGIVALNMAFPSNKLSMEEDNLEIWHKALRDLTDEMFEIAVLSLIRNSKFYPCIAEIRKTAIELCIENATKTGEEAWGEVMEQFDITGDWEEPKFDDPITEKTVKALGWRVMCNSDIDQIGVLRAHFIKIYNSMKRRETTKNELKAINPKYYAMIQANTDKLRIK